MMDRSEIFEKIQDICRDVFEDDEIIIHETTTANDIEAWDSLTHLSLMSEVEMLFDIAFTLDEQKNSKDIGELVNTIMKHLSERG